MKKSFTSEEKASLERAIGHFRRDIASYVCEHQRIFTSTPRAVSNNFKLGGDYVMHGKEVYALSVTYLYPLINFKPLLTTFASTLRGESGVRYPDGTPTDKQSLQVYFGYPSETSCQIYSSVFREPKAQIRSCIKLIVPGRQKKKINHHYDMRASLELSKRIRKWAEKHGYPCGWDKNSRGLHSQYYLLNKLDKKSPTTLLKR